MTETIRRRLQKLTSHAGQGRQVLRGCLWTGVFLALLLSVSPSHAQLDVIKNTVGRIENKVGDVQGKVNTIRTRTGAILTNTNGMQDLVGNVQDITSGFQPAVFDDIRAALQDAQALLQFAKSQAADALANRSDHPDLVALVRGLEGALKGLLGDAGDNLNLGVFTSLLEILPDQVLAVAGQGFLIAGIDQAFVLEFQLATDYLALLQQATESQANDSTNQLTNDSANQLPLFLAGGTRCTFFNDRRNAIDAAANGLDKIGKVLRVAGKIIASQADTVSTADEVNLGLHGYASFNVETDFLGTLGEMTEFVGDAYIGFADTGSAKLEHCEVLLYQQSVLDAICRLSRGGGNVCERWVGSAEQDALRNRSQ